MHLDVEKNVMKKRYGEKNGLYSSKKWGETAEGKKTWHGHF